MSVTQEGPSEAPAKTDEIKSEFELRIGRHITLQGSASITPRGVIAAGVAVAIMTLAAGYLVSSIGRRKSGQEPANRATTPLLPRVRDR